MAVRVKPVKKKRSVERSEVENAVHYYRRDVDARPSPTGSFLGAFVHHSGVPAFYAQTFDTADYDDFVGRISRADPDGDRLCHHVAPGDAAGFEQAPLLRIKESSPAPLMWRRRTMGQRRYSIASEIEKLDRTGMFEMLGGLLTAPVQPWDAVIVPSKALKQAAQSAVDRHADYLSTRLGVRPELPCSISVIPPGINTASFAVTDDWTRARAGVRRRLGINDDDFCVLTTGSFSFYDRVHPVPLYLALEMAARRSSARIHLLQAGWFESERAERSYRDAVRDFAPAVNAVFLDSRDGDIRERVWAAADAYAAFHDTIGHGVDPEMLEAMAAGLPIVAADWGSNRDIVPHGEIGYLVPSWLPLPESGGDLTFAPENEIGRGASQNVASGADAFLSGTVGQTTAVDVRIASEAFQSLASDVEKRRGFGQLARERAKEKYDWASVVRRHQALWSELRRIRSDAIEVAPPLSGQAAIPHMDDPFRTHTGYASHVIGGNATVSLTPGLASGEGIAHRLARIRANPINDVAGAILLNVDEQIHLLDHLADVENLTVTQMADLLVPERRFRLPRTLGWFAKYGIIRLIPSMEERVSASDEGVPAVELGIAARHEGADRDAAGYFRTALSHNPNDAVANQQLGELLAASNRFDDAAAHFERALVGNPAAVSARLDLGKIKVLKGDHAGGVAEMQQAVELAPDNPEAQQLLGVAYRRAGATDDAIRALEQSVRLDPKRIDALLHLGYARKSIGRRAEALQAFRDVLRLAPQHMLARSGEMSLGVEQTGRKRLERDGSTRRIALYFSGAQEFTAQQSMFQALADAHWPLLTGDIQDFAEFRPDVVVSVGLQTAELRRLAPNALIVSAPAFLASQNRFPLAFEGADYVFAPSELIADSWTRLGLVRADRVMACGYLPMDHLLEDKSSHVPSEMVGVGATVLYAPALRPQLSSAQMLGEDVAERIRGAREDVTVVIKPHPEMFERRPQWINVWRRAVRKHENLVLADDPNQLIHSLMRSADVLVSDVSSAIFEFMAIDRPILLLRNPDSVNDELGYDAQGIEWRWRDVGREIINSDDLARAVDLALKTPEAGREIRDRYKAAAFGDTMDGLTGRRMADLITELST